MKMPSHSLIRLAMRASFLGVLAFAGLAQNSSFLAQAAPDTTYQVTNVASDDVLNIRAVPDHQAHIIGTLAPGTSGVRQTGNDKQVADARWVEIHHQGLTGWVNEHFLKRAAPPAPPAFFHERLVCSGTEPFWGLEIDGKNGALDSLAEGRADIAFETVRNAQGVPVLWSFRGKDVRTGKAAISILEETGQCSDSMSDLTYRYSIRLDIEDGPFFAGCCNRLPGQPDP